VTGKVVEIAPFEIGRMIADGLNRFCRSADIRPAAQHIVVDEKIDEALAADLRLYLLPYVGHLWEEVAAVRAASAITPDVLLKLWALPAPRIEAVQDYRGEHNRKAGAGTGTLDRHVKEPRMHVRGPPGRSALFVQDAHTSYAILSQIPGGSLWRAAADGNRPSLAVRNLPARR